jgi:hypothetical protein
MTTLEQIKKIEPDAFSFIEGKTSFIVTNNDGTTTSFHKDLLNSTLSKEKRQYAYRENHQHKGSISNCWECGRRFCWYCKGEYANFYEEYCGC